MRLLKFFALFWIGLLWSCAPSSPQPAPRTAKPVEPSAFPSAPGPLPSTPPRLAEHPANKNPAEAAPKTTASKPTPTPATPQHPLTVRTGSKNGIDFTAVTFDRRNYFLKVIDQKGGPGSRFAKAEAAGRSQNGLAAINGGFFSPEGKPVGLVITNGEARGYFNSSSFLGTGILDGQKVSLATRTTYQRSSELLQSGPRLVWEGETLTGLSRDNPRARSFLIWDGAEHFGLAYADSASLKALSDALKSQPFAGFKIKYAVNLDGGTSCDLWVSDLVRGGGFTKSPFFRKAARNYLVLRDR